MKVECVDISKADFAWKIPMNAAMKTSVRMEMDPVGLDKVSWINPVVPTRPMTERFELPMDLTTLEGRG